MSIERSQLRGRFKEISNGTGGQGSTYDVAGAKVVGLPAVYKEYHESALGQLDLSVIDGMIADAYELSQRDGGRELDSMLALCAWPLESVTHWGRPVGVLMPRIPDRYFIYFKRTRGGTERIEAKFELLLNGDAYLTKHIGTVTPQEKRQLLAAVALGMKTLHGKQICVGDLSPINLLWSLKPTPAVYFIDCDSFCRQGKSASGLVETPGWEVRPGEQLGTVAADVYKFGLMVLRLLAGDQMTRDPKALPRGTTRKVRELVKRSLDSMPSKRPAMSEWCDALGAGNPCSYGLTPAAAEFCKTALKWTAAILAGFMLLAVCIRYWWVLVLLAFLAVFA